ncbi:unnamed protein product [Lepeophtheirus salmonis]|uniref:(salmon louse) hypothetical protein n=1 Tax=Lepeophtheirus salmonis TaxID=72036 RepID=A0A7R8HDL7_LEPSM|nr:unnamed protein product [Lepeophtheirus salmonis]CAF3031657.1 unnamed protein product [Lepeophtheirus salmonis]
MFEVLSPEGVCQCTKKECTPRNGTRSRSRDQAVREYHGRNRRFTPEAQEMMANLEKEILIQHGADSVRVMNAEIQKCLPYKLSLGCIKKRRALPSSKAQGELLCADITPNPNSTKFGSAWTELEVDTMVDVKRGHDGDQEDLAWNLVKLFYGRSVESIEAKLLSKEFRAVKELMPVEATEVSDTDDVNISEEERWIDQVIQSTPNAKKVLAENRDSVARTKTGLKVFRPAVDTLPLKTPSPKSKSDVSTASLTEQVLVECDLPVTLFASQDPKASSEEGELSEADLMEIASNVPSCEGSMLGMSEHECLNESVTAWDPKASSEEGELSEADLMEIASNVPSCEGSMFGMSEHECLNESVTAWVRGRRVRSSVEGDTHKGCEMRAMIVSHTGANKKAANKKKKTKENKNKKDPKASSEEGELSEADLMEIASNVPSCEGSMLGMSEHECLNESVTAWVRGRRLRSSVEGDTHKGCEMRAMIVSHTGANKKAGNKKKKTKENKNKKVIEKKEKEIKKDTSKTSRTKKAKVERGAMDRIRALEVGMDRALAMINSTLQALRPISEKGINPRKSLRTTHGGRSTLKPRHKFVQHVEMQEKSGKFAVVKRGQCNKPVVIPKPGPSGRQLRSANGWEKSRESSQCPVHCMNRFEALEEKQALLSKAAGIVGKRPKKGINPQDRRAVHASTQRGWEKDRTKLVRRILEGKSVLEEAKPPPEEVLPEWEKVFLAPSVEDGRDPVALIDPMEVLMNEATIEEVRAAIPKDNTSPGPDGITLSEIKKLEISSLTRWINKY